MTCIRRVTRLDRLILGARTQEQAEAKAHEPVCRLLVLRLQVMAVVALMIAVAGTGLMWELNRRDAKVARQQAAEIVASQCVDKAGNIAFRNVLINLVTLNEGGKLTDPALARLPRRAQTAAVLRNALDQAGQAPTCILRVP